MAQEPNATRDPVIEWLEEIRDQSQSTERARVMARMAIERLAAAAAPAAAPKSVADEKIDRLVEESKAETERGRKARRQ